MIRILIFSSLIFLFTGCSTNESLFQVQMVTTFQIPLGLNTLESHYFVSQDVPSSLASQLNNLNIDPSEVSQVVASGGFLRPRFANDINLDFINDVSVFIVDPLNLNDRTEIFFQDNIQFGNKTSIPLNGNLPDLTERLLNNTVRLETRLVFRQFPPQTFEVLLDLEFSVFTQE